MLIFQGDGTDVQFVAALDTATGKLAWKTARGCEANLSEHYKKCNGTPLLVEIAGHQVLASNGAGWFYGYDPDDGRELWKVRFNSMGYSVTARPVSGNGMVYFSTGYLTPRIWALNFDAAGLPQVAWIGSKQGPTMPSPLLVGSELCAASDSGMVTCLDSATGAEHYHERLERTIHAAPIFADGRLYFFGTSGTTHVLAPGKLFTKLAENKLDEVIKASPAAVDGTFFIRTEKSLYRIEAVTQSPR
ncbi:hypothetical protein BH11VER1_BH11VER1_09790 [soil metagenome]